MNKPIALLSYFLLLALLSFCHSESNAFLTLKGNRQGNIPGSVTQKGKEGQIQVVAYDWSITSPIDPATGQATGKIQVQPLKIVKPVDKSTPKLLTALVQGEVLNTFTLNFWRAPSTGAQQIYYTVKLVSAKIVSIHQISLDNRVSPHIPLSEEVTFVAQSVQEIWVDGNIVSQTSTTSA